MATDDQASPADPPPPGDPLRTQLLEAAARVIAAKGYYDTKIMDVVREAGLSAGALYGRFESKSDLLKAAVIDVTLARSRSWEIDRSSVAEYTVDAAQKRQPLSDGEALHVEAFVAARRDEEVAKAVRQAQRLRRTALQPVVDVAVGGATSAATDARVDTLLYFFETLHLGILLQRSAGIRPPDPGEWEEVVTELVRHLLEGVVPDQSTGAGGAT